MVLVNLNMIIDYLPKQTREIVLAIVVYVDDVLLVGSKMDSLVGLKKYLHHMFTIKKFGRT